MNIALYCWTITEPSYTVQDGTAYYYGTEKPFINPLGWGSEMFRNIWSLPFAFDGASFISWYRGLPPEDFDVVFYCCDDEHNLAGIPGARRLNPNALFIGYSKERRRGMLTDHQRNCFKQCDTIATPHPDVDFLQDRINKPTYFFPYPYNWKWMQSKLKEVQKEGWIMVNTRESRGFKRALSFAESVQTPERLVVVPPESTWPQWLETIAESSYFINFDDAPTFGQVGAECAILGCTHLGSVSSSAHTLWPKTYGLDEEAMRQCFEQDNSELNQFAFDQVKNYYSFEAANLNLMNILRENG